jgi:tRNA 2-thiocytidine biosynthesis protein TtcA
MNPSLKLEMSGIADISANFCYYPAMVLKPLDREARQTAARLAKKLARAFLTFPMLNENERILVALSGGKDSLSMLYLLTRLQKSWETPFYIKALHIRSDFSGCSADIRMEEIINSWGVDYEILDVPIRGRLKPGRSLNCYWCSTQRRMELLRYAEAHDFDLIALGHHQDDILETLLMNMAYKGEISTMMPVMTYDKYPQRVIRPLCYIKEREIVEFAELMGFSTYATSCPHGQTSKRLEARKALELLSSRGEYVKDKMFESMSRVNLDYLPVQDGLEASSVG